jgi:hypothetical protein
VEVDHLPGIATFGFVVEEEEAARNIDPDRAKELGVLHKGKKYHLLKHGFSVLTEDGSREVRPEEVYKARSKRARKVAIVGDNRGWTPQMIDLAKNADVLIHEATLTEEDLSVSIKPLVNDLFVDAGLIAFYSFLARSFDSVDGWSSIWQRGCEVVDPKPYQFEIRQGRNRRRERKQSITTHSRREKSF